MATEINETGTSSTSATDPWGFYRGALNSYVNGIRILAYGRHDNGDND